MEQVRIKVLLIEADEISRESVARVLEAEGFETCSAPDGETGLARAQEMLPDVIVLDLNLPGIDGEQVIKLIRGDQRLGAVPIVIITGDPTTTAEAAVELGADKYFLKPVEVDDLINAITSLHST